MAAIGQLAAGIAHEINNPLNFIQGNLSHVHDYIQQLLGLLQIYQQYYQQQITDLPVAIQTQIQDIEPEFISKDLVKILQSMKTGTKRISDIVNSLQNFSRLDEAEFKAVDIHEGIDNALLLLHHRLQAKVDRPEITIVRDYGSFPPVPCYAGELNQVFMNLLSNAIDALDESYKNRSLEEIAANPCTIWIHTSLTGDNRLQITIADNGKGMPKEVQLHALNPFFTTKAIGKGIGMGLCTSYQIVTEKHQGKLCYTSCADQGTKFMIEIPLMSENSQQG